MKNLSYHFAVICCLVLLVNRQTYAQQAEYLNVITTYKTVISKAVTGAERASNLAELVEAHKASDKVLSLKDLHHFYGSESHYCVGVPGYASRSDTTAKASKKPIKLKAALIGGAIGALSGLLLYEIIDSSEFGGFVCNEGDPGCTTHKNYSRNGMMLTFGGIGAVIGFVVGN